LITAIAIDSEAGRHAEGEIRHVFVGLGGTEKTPMPGAVREALEPFAA
jgi:acyl-CoA thioesterase FadM